MLLDTEQLDALAELVNIGVGRGAASLSALVQERIALRVPRVKICGMDELLNEFEASGQPVDTSVVQGFSGQIDGQAMLAFPRKSGIALAKLLGEEEPDLSDSGDEDLEFDLAEVLEEIGNIVLNGVLGTLANLFEDDFRYSVPELCTGSPADALVRDGSSSQIGEEPTCLLADTRFDLADSHISGSLLLAFNTEQLASLLNQLLSSVDA